MGLNREIQHLAKKLNDKLGMLKFPDHVACVYNTFDYAFGGYAAYTNKFVQDPKKILFLGMNPGPWGMVQTGVPFGEVAAVRDWMGLHVEIQKPQPEHPKRPVEGLDCVRSEVSGRRLWGLFDDRFDSAQAFFKNHFVANYCPLAFMEAGGRNLTPDKLPASIANPLEDACDWHLQELTGLLEPEWVVGVGGFAETRARSALGSASVRIGRILHPSPASPAANRDWAGTATRQLVELGIWNEQAVIPCNTD